MMDISEQLGLINPVDFTRVFVHPDSEADLISRVKRMREQFILIEHVRLKLVTNRNMPLGKVFFGGQVLTISDYPIQYDKGETTKIEKEDPNAVHETKCT